MRSVRPAAAVALLGLVALACGTSAPAPRAAATAPTQSSTEPATTLTSTSTSTSTSAASATTTTLATSTTAARVAITSSPTTTAAAVATALADPRLAEVGSAGQAVIVTAASYGATTATLTAYERTGTGWRAVFGPWTARVGTKGVAPPGAKQEGDGRTPSGVYGFDFFFGVAPDPGVAFPFRRVTSRSIVWDDDPTSPRYNEWVDLDAEPAGAAGADPEPMYNPPAYDYGAVIAYNTSRTPGLGSAIFLHVSTGGPTAGCVSLPADQLLQVLRWLDPSRQPRIAVSIAA